MRLGNLNDSNVGLDSKSPSNKNEEVIVCDCAPNLGVWGSVVRGSF